MLVEDTEKSGPVTAREYVEAHPTKVPSELKELAAKNGHKLTTGALQSARARVKGWTAKGGKPAKVRPGPKAGGAVNASDFVRGQPLDVPPLEVIRRAKEAGIVVKLGLIHTLRSMMRRGLDPSTRTHSRPAHSHAGHSHAPKKNKGGAKKGVPRDGSIARFVDRYPNLKAQDVVEIARREGLPISLQSVYRVRTMSRRNPAQLPLRGTEIMVRQPGPAGSARRVVAGANDDERLLRQLIVRKGIDWCRDIVNDAEQRLLASLEGIGE